MAEREGCAQSLPSFRLPAVAEPSIPLLAEYTISNRAPSASRASLRGLAIREIQSVSISLTSNFLYLKLQVMGSHRSRQRRDTLNDRLLTLGFAVSSYTLKVVSYK